MNDNTQEVVVTQNEQPVTQEQTKYDFQFVRFWVKDSGNLTSHSKGLTPGQVEFFKSLVVDDRLVMYKERDGSYTLKRFKRENELKR